MSSVSKHAQRDELLAAAREAAKSAYCRYSNFHVGAAVLVRGKIIPGCNVENASYGLTICAERVAIFSAVAGGQLPIEAIAVACVDASSSGPLEGKMPCGACRQVIFEFGGPNIPVFVDGAGDYLLGDLLPYAFQLTDHADWFHDAERIPY